MIKTWGDLFEIDNERSPDRANLWAYWRQLIGGLRRDGLQRFSLRRRLQGAGRSLALS